MNNKSIISMKYTVAIIILLLSLNNAIEAQTNGTFYVLYGDTNYMVEKDLVWKLKTDLHDGTYKVYSSNNFISSKQLKDFKKKISKSSTGLFQCLIGSSKREYRLDYSIEYENGSPHGLYMNYQGKNLTLYGFYVNGKKDGLWINWIPLLKKKPETSENSFKGYYKLREEYYKDGVSIWEREYYSNGNKYEEIYYDSTNKPKSITYWYDNGNKALEAVIVNSNTQYWKKWFYNGNLEMEATGDFFIKVDSKETARLMENKPNFFHPKNGKIKRWNEKGETLKTDEYVENNLIEGN